jgi:hypothetical protein
VLSSWLWFIITSCCCCRCCRFVSGETLVVDGGAWLHRPQLVPRGMVSQVSRKVESSSRQVGTAQAGGTRSSSSAAPRSKL